MKFTHTLSTLAATPRPTARPTAARASADAGAGAADAADLSGTTRRGLLAGAAAAAAASSLLASAPAFAGTVVTSDWEQVRRRRGRENALSHERAQNTHDPATGG